MTKAGFREIAIMRLRRRGPRTHVDVEVLDADPTGAALARSLNRQR